VHVTVRKLDGWTPLIQTLNGVALAPFKNLSNAMGLASDVPRYASVSSPRDPLLVAVQKLVQGVDVIYRIGKQAWPWRVSSSCHTG